MPEGTAVDGGGAMFTPEGLLVETGSFERVRGESNFKLRAAEALAPEVRLSLGDIGGSAPYPSAFRSLAHSCSRRSMRLCRLRASSSSVITSCNS